MKEQLTRKQQSLIINLLSSESVEEACKSSGVSKSSFYRWLKTDSNFRREFSDAKAATFSEAISRLAQTSSTIAKVLEEIATNSSMPATARVSACRAILEWSNRSLETESLAVDARELADELRRRKSKRNER